MSLQGVTNLPLHPGKAPKWLFHRMVKLSKVLVEFMVDDGQKTDQILNNIANPYWFQALSCVIGFDWHSSGTTTTTCGALKLAINNTDNIDLRVTGGKGKASRRTPEELESFGEALSINSTTVKNLQHSSKLTAKVDSSLIQDGYQLYHHNMFIDKYGNWTIVQQGMGDNYARRYQWFSKEVEKLTIDPHTAIGCDTIHDSVMNMTSKYSVENQKSCVDLVNDNPTHLRKYIEQKNGQKSLYTYLDNENGENVKIYSMPAHHKIYKHDLKDSDWKIIENAYEIQPDNYEELVMVKGMGAKKIRALALISHFLFGNEVSWKDPVKYSFTHGGKDGIPFPVERDTYDHSIDFFKDMLNSSELQKEERKRALKRLGKIIS